ncbi:MAG: dihydrolipoyl dehydrogenase [Candidatus Izemoplasmatales bacterium]
MNVYDLIVIGGGPGGYHAAFLAGKAGLSTLIVEKNKLGGVCLNEGCIPSKAFLHSAKLYSHAKHGADYGIHVKDVSYDQRAVVKRKNQVVKTLVAGVDYMLKSANVDVVSGSAKITGKTASGFTIIVGDVEYTGRKLISATGSIPFIPPIEGLTDAIKNGTMLTSREILDLQEIPQKLSIIGGGVIGLEMAMYFSQVGSEVTIIEMLPDIGGGIDADLSKGLKRLLKAKGVALILNAKVTKIEPQKITYLDNNQQYHTITHDCALLSAGRKANTAGLGLESINVELRKDGSIVTDEQMNTNVANVYAIGDVNGKVMLAHTAYREAEVCFNNLTGKKDQINYNVIPSVIYTSLEACSVGYTEADANKAGYDFKTVTLPIAYSGRHMAESNDRGGFLKLIIDQKKNTLIGAHMLSLYASEIAVFLGAMLNLEIDIKEIKRLIYPHPTVGELVKDALFRI